jgi:hypothetical protein
VSIALPRPHGFVVVPSIGLPTSGSGQRSTPSKPTSLAVLPLKVVTIGGAADTGT